MCWCECKILNNSIEGRYLFAYGQCDSRLFVFGGMSEDSYVGGKPICLETAYDEGKLYFLIDST